MEIVWVESLLKIIVLNLVNEKFHITNIWSSGFNEKSFDINILA